MQATQPSLSFLIPNKSMAIIPILLHLLPLLPLQFFFPSIISAASYTTFNMYFLNCGSESDANFGLQRRFISDLKPDPLPIEVRPGKSKLIRDDTISTTIPEIYHTARVYNRLTWYVFNSINQNGTYVVRLHFFPHQNLPQARFNVFTNNGFQLLSNFSRHNTDLKTPTVEEFIFEIERGPFGIHFSPLESSLAFVNAIELFLAPEFSKPESADAVLTQGRINDSFQNEMASRAFRATYRYLKYEGIVVLNKWYQSYKRKVTSTTSRGPKGTTGKYFNIHMEDGTLVNSHINEMNKLMNQLESMEITFSGEVKAINYFDACIFRQELVHILYYRSWRGVDEKWENLQEHRNCDVRLRTDNATEVSMGGSLVTPDNDTVWRTWLPDDEFLASPSAAKNISYSGKIEYMATSIYVAPIYVYNTAKALKMDTTGRSKLSNLTWAFKVKKNGKYFVVLHFCEIIVEERGKVLHFDFLSGSNRVTLLGSTEKGHIHQIGELFTLKFVIGSDDSGYLNMSIARSRDAPQSIPFLNGVEIMELIEKSFVGAPVLKLKQKKNHNLGIVVVGVCVGGAVITGLLIGLILCYFRGPLFVTDQNERPLEGTVSIVDLAPNFNLKLKIPFGEISAATDGFDEKKTIGVGGFGKVYYAKLGEKEVAVKRSRPGFGQGFKEFHTEIIILSQIRHRHLVSLYGYCHENEEMILVYEYMEGGTLRDYLYGSRKSHDYDHHPPLSWQKRLQICIDAAKGLDYLHTSTAAGVIIHRDIKTTNILLDKNATAKVADFGISKFGESDAKELYTTIRGTYGYLDPEYLNTGQLTEKSDVYSFGVVLLEVLSGRPPIVNSVRSDEEINLADWAILCRSKGVVEKLIDPFLMGTIEANSLRKFLEVSEICVSEVGAERPSMHDVVYGLECALKFQLKPVVSEKAFDCNTTIG
ncbi:probable receptor-like protein kinase At2g23200 [Momordica charantia]|uniref:non-specific serine/threonine protein kinase n=1 Tax=Momordica charantia TaxID=3673 RepID=A0A6J1D824_MOMCH|nr:probable receptor-like protein kinase At2g23200 [Momordica charantia]